MLFYASSHYRQLLAHAPEGAQQFGDKREERLSLVDRFGLRLGFHAMEHSCWLAIIENCVKRWGLSLQEEQWKPEALAWLASHGSRTGRSAWQFCESFAAKNGIEPERLNAMRYLELREAEKEWKTRPKQFRSN